MSGKMILLAAFAVLTLSFASSGESSGSRRDAAVLHMRNGNYRDAAILFRELALAEDATPRTVVADLRNAVACYRNLGETELADSLRDAVLDRWGESWRVLSAVADIWIRSRGEDGRVAALSLLVRAEPLLDGSGDPATAGEKSDFYGFLADALSIGREGRLAWRLTALTRLDEEPSAGNEFALYRMQQRDAPVGADGEPVQYSVPASWDAAANDGERWRWALSRMDAPQADLRLGRFLHGQFGVQTIGAGFVADSGAFAVRTLGEDETLARLATGIKRFSLPDEFNPITVLRRAADSGVPVVRRESLALLARIFEDRQQYNKAVLHWEMLDASGVSDGEGRDAVRRITGNNGVLEPGAAAPAGSVTSVSYLFRNGESVRLTARRLDEKKLLGDIREQVLAGSDEIYREFSLRRPEMLGRAVVTQNRDRYLGETVASWDVSLEPLPDYYSRRVQIDLPFTDAGCYLVEAAMRDGNVSRVVVWISDLALVRRNVGAGQLHFVADAVTGEPVGGAELTFMGFETRYNPASDRTDVAGTVFAERADDSGVCVVDAARLAEKEWLVVAETADGRLAYVGFDPFWTLPDGDVREENPSAFIITDRPVYRPGQDVRFKFWLARAGNVRNARVAIYNPRGEAVYEKTLSTDAHGGADDTLTLGDDAVLGGYSVQVADGIGYASFRLEEYKKPEYEVVVETPVEAVALGDKVQVKVRANYYYGAPVQDATVSYRIVRSRFAREWTPPWRWGWLYGPQVQPRPEPRMWMPLPFEQPEVVAEGEGAIDSDGVFRIDVDTLPAKELFGDADHSYQITAEVTDRSRRAIVGSGRVVASRKPFAVAVWTNRGYYPAGQEIVAVFRAMLPLGGGVAASGTVTVSKIIYGDFATPAETVSATTTIETDAEGNASWRFSLADAGQYRLLCRLEDAAGNVAEESAVITVRGKPGEGDFRFAALEVVADKREYAVGETARIAVNSENTEGTVLFFSRAERGSLPDFLRMENGGGMVEIPVGENDQPNFFCEAVTVYKGRVYVETREIFVPPAEKTLVVDVTPDKPAYAPGEKASFTVAVTDENRRPVQGQCVVSLYDKSVEYISGGSNVGDIREHFWNWKRYHSPAATDSLSKTPYSVNRHDDVRWEPIGVFGAQEADWNGGDAVATNRSARFGGVKVLRGAVPAAPEAMVMMESATVLMPVPATGGMPMMAKAEMAADQAAPAFAEAAVRSEFADTALWIAALETDAAGKASFTLDMPENLTAWKTRVWALADGIRVGEGGDEVETKKNVVVRPQSPRFLTQTDQVVLSANVHNYLPRAKTARVEIALEGGTLTLASDQTAVRDVEIAAGGEARIDWLADARRPGDARVVMKVLTDEESDAAEIVIPVLLHGARRVEGFGGVMRDGTPETFISVVVPRERLADRSRLELSFSPGVAGSMIDALPFLAEYPYGSTEQTLNRFLPVVMVRKFLADTGINPAAAKARSSSVLLDDAATAKMVAAGVERLTSMQNPDGGWGWFSGFGEQSGAHTTAVVTHGLVAARASGAAIPLGVLDGGINWLRAYQAEQIARLKRDPEIRNSKIRADNTDAFVYMILAEDGRRPLDPDMRDFLYRDRLGLSPAGLAMFGIALHHEKATLALAMVTQNLRQFVHTDAENGTAWLDVPGDGWWRWYNDAVETQAWYLKMLSLVEPRGDTASDVAKYLVENKRNGTHWRSTRDTAYAIEALASYSAASGENAPDCEVTVYYGGEAVMTRTLTRENILDDNRFVLEGMAIEEGAHELRIVRSGSGNIHFGGALDLFSLEDPIPAAGGDLRVSRKFFRLIPEGKTVDRPSASGVAVAGRAEGRRREPLESGASIRAGDLVEVELVVAAKNDYEYLVFEDMKAAGLEAVELQSGYGANSFGAYVEYRDEKVVLFVREMPRGEHTMAYRFRAGTPGRYSALPASGGGMYAPELFGNSDEMKIVVDEK